jgi:hypothetical protein
MKAYVEFEISEGAYELSCPDALCNSQGIVSLAEISLLATPSLVAKHHRYRLNRGLLKRQNNFQTFNKKICPLQKSNLTKIACGVQIVTVKQFAQLVQLTGLRRVNSQHRQMLRYRCRGPFCVQRAL